MIFLDLSVVLMSLYFVCRSIKKIYCGKYSMLHFCVIIFFVMQVLPLFIGCFGSMDKIKQYYPYMYYAMTDFDVTWIYDLFVIICIFILSYNADKLAKKSKNKALLKNLRLGEKRVYVAIIAAILMLVPLFGIIIAPNPKIYLEFSYFYMNKYSANGIDYLYYNTVMKMLTYLSFGAMLTFYYTARKYKKIYTYMVIIGLTWLNGKRTLMVFMLLGILVIDFLKWDKHNKSYIKSLIYKAFLFLCVIVIYYVLYKDTTGKSDFADSYLLYTTYFSRLCNVKVAIYDRLNGLNMLDYSGQTLLHDVLFFIPRSLWKNKPYPYFRYFTSYVYYGVSDKVVPNMQFQVNMWSEFISNAGILGFVLALVMVINMIRKCEKANNSIILLLGSGFVFLYMMYGFEHIVQIVFVIWVLASLRWRIKGKIVFRSKI